MNGKERRRACGGRRAWRAPRTRRGPAPVLLLLPFVVSAVSCEWFTDFKRQPAISTWQVVGDSTRPSRTNPLMSVPTTGMMVSAAQVSYAPLPAVIDSMSGLANPTAPDARSIQNGHRYYQINCAVCHGDRGIGDGPATRFGMVGINIAGDITRARSDGYIWGIIRNGRGLMPSYNRIEERSRWDVVNYVRALQSTTPDLAVGPIAAPGVTGAAVPGGTRIGPTVPVPYWGHPARSTQRAPLPPADTVAPTAPTEPAPSRAVPQDGVQTDTGAIQ